MPYQKSIATEVKEMWTLVLSQQQKSLRALLVLDKDLAREVILIEQRVNNREQFIESACEHYFSLRTLQPINISFAMFALKTTRHLELIGDLANKIAVDILNTEPGFAKELITKTSIQETFRSSNKILELSLKAFVENDTSLGQVCLNRCQVCQEMVLECKQDLAEYLKGHPHQNTQLLNLFSVLESLKRTLEAIQNISAGIINYRETSAIQA